MLTLFKKAKSLASKEVTETNSPDEHDTAEMNAAAQRFIEQVTDEATMKKNIEAKLRKYRPVDREADFSKNDLYR